MILAETIWIHRLQSGADCLPAEKGSSILTGCPAPALPQAFGVLTAFSRPDLAGDLERRLDDPCFAYGVDGDFGLWEYLRFIFCLRYSSMFTTPFFLKVPRRPDGWWPSSCYCRAQRRPRLVSI